MFKVTKRITKCRRKYHSLALTSFSFQPRMIASFIFVQFEDVTILIASNISRIFKSKSIAWEAGNQGNYSNRKEICIVWYSCQGVWREKKDKKRNGIHMWLEILKWKRNREPRSQGIGIWQLAIGNWQVWLINQYDFKRITTKYK